MFSLKNVKKSVTVRIPESVQNYATLSCKILKYSM